MIAAFVIGILAILINLIAESIDYEKLWIDRLADRSRKNDMLRKKKRSMKWGSVR